MVERGSTAMVKPARRYDLYLPITFNDGRAIPEERFVSLEQKLLSRFGGVTSQQRDFPLRGMWQGHVLVFLDQVIVMSVLDFRRGGSLRFIADLKRDLIREFVQIEILITEAPLRVH
jgi:hypothetical protein